MPSGVTHQHTGTYKFWVLISSWHLFVPLNTLRSVKLPLKQQLGAGLRAYRHSLGATQEQLAEALGITPRYLAGIERGERNLSLDSVDRLADDLGISPIILLNPSEDLGRARVLPRQFSRDGG